MEQKTSLLFLFLMMVLLNTLGEHVNYIKSNGSLLLDCPGQPCLTLDQYAEQAATYFISGATFIFLPGNHSLQTAITLMNVSDVALRRGEGDYDTVISCELEVAILCEGVTNVTVKGLQFLMDLNGNDSDTTCLLILNSSGILIEDVVFQGSKEISARSRTINVQHSTLTVVNCHFGGGALYSQNCTLTIIGSIFKGTNSNGGAIDAVKSHLIFQENNEFSNNSARLGGAINAAKSYLNISGENILFSNNSAVCGGAIYLIQSYINIASESALFINNKATLQGGAICFHESNATLSGKAIKFENNLAKSGGGMFILNSQVFAIAIFEGNTAVKGGGLFGISDKNVMLISARFIGNAATECGGAVYVEEHMNLHFIKGVRITSNLGTALCILSGRIAFSGTTYINNNTGKLGGAMMVNSKNVVSFSGYTYFSRNRGYTGGAIYTFVRATLTFNGFTSFEHNTAKTDGGAIYALGSNITFWVPKEVLGTSVISFRNNSAVNGGAIYLGSASTMNLDAYAKLSTYHNYASKYGGMLFHEDIATPIQCNYEEHRDETDIDKLPYCFLNISGYEIAPQLYTLQSQNDSAKSDGAFIYGGLLDRCQMYQTPLFSERVPFYNWVGKIFTVDKYHAITSQPYQLCFCDSEDQYDCSGVKTITAHRGQKFKLSLIALDQLRKGTSTQVNAKTSQTGELRFNQSIQFLQENCSSLSYTIYSAADTEELILYPDGPCRDTGLALAVINITLLPCPNGFIKSSEVCICEKRLQACNATCVIDEDIHIVIKDCWINATYVNDSYYQGLILHKACPAGYCRHELLKLTLDEPDVQCTNHRTGILCGACAQSYSLMLGSTRCAKCSNSYLALLLPFAAAGVLLVVFLSILRLTVASGMVNSIVLYANIVQVNRNLFLSVHNESNILTVFIAWINLDLGIEICFYDGMSAYAQVWLQFVFPIYVWTLIGLIILTSRYSITVSKFIGHDPVAVLATLLLMSYTKILKAFVDIYSYADLSYPHNNKPVWLKDGNVLYLKSQHLLLTVVISLFLVLLFLPYTILLLVGYKLYSLSNRKIFYWLYRLKPFLDSYYAPYKKDTRFWTGFLLLIRCLLYLSFSFHQQTLSSLALIITFTALILLGWSLKWLYAKVQVIIVEFSVYFNIVALSVATLVHINSAPLVYSLIGLVFFTTICIIVCQFHIIYVTKSHVWSKMMAKVARFKEKYRSPPPVTAPTVFSTQNQHKMATKTVIDLRETLLEK